MIALPIEDEQSIATLAAGSLRNPGPRCLEAHITHLASLASSNVDHWPTISVWHGSWDHTVAPSNAHAIVRQWQVLHHVEGPPTRTELVDGYPRRVWCDASGREVIEEYSITKMGHGTPLETGGAEGYGASGDYMLEVGISSTRHIARFWGLDKFKNE
jgi:poly(3-hydroxybutyrate) depolymerase